MNTVAEERRVDGLAPADRRGDGAVCLHDCLEVVEAHRRVSPGVERLQHHELPPSVDRQVESGQLGRVVWLSIDPKQAVPEAGDPGPIWKMDVNATRKVRRHSVILSSSVRGCLLAAALWRGSIREVHDLDEVARFTDRQIDSRASIVDAYAARRHESDGNRDTEILVLVAKAVRTRNDPSSGASAGRDKVAR